MRACQYGVAQGIAGCSPSNIEVVFSGHVHKEVAFISLQNLESDAERQGLVRALVIVHEGLLILGLGEKQVAEPRMCNIMQNSRQDEGEELQICEVCIQPVLRQYAQERLRDVGSMRAVVVRVWPAAAPAV